MADCTYDPDTRELHVGSGVIAGLTAEFWGYTISGWPVVPRWLGQRTSKGVGRDATRPQPLDRIRPASWADDWNDELLDLLRLTHTISTHPEQADPLERILTAGTFTAAELPQPAAYERRPPAG